MYICIQYDENQVGYICNRRLSSRRIEFFFLNLFSICISSGLSGGLEQSLFNRRDTVAEALDRDMKLGWGITCWSGAPTYVQWLTDWLTGPPTHSLTPSPAHSSPAHWPRINVRGPYKAAKQPIDRIWAERWHQPAPNNEWISSLESTRTLFMLLQYGDHTHLLFFWFSCFSVMTSVTVVCLFSFLGFSQKSWGKVRSIVTQELKPMLSFIDWFY